MVHLSNPEEKESQSARISEDGTAGGKKSREASEEYHSHVHEPHVIPAEQERRNTDILQSYTRKKASGLVVIAGALILVIAVIVVLMLVSASVEKKPVYYYSLQGSLSGWTTKGSPPGLIASAVGPPRDGKTSKCMRYVYKATAGGFTGVVKMMPDLKGLTSIDFWIWSKLDGEFVLGLEEDDGSSYIYIFQAPKEKWTHVEAAPERFMMNQDSQDENGMLDTDQLSSPLFVADVSGLRGKEYENTIYMADLTIRRTVPKTVIRIRGLKRQ